MIKSFRHAGLQAFYETGSKAGIRPDHAPRLKRILGVLDAAMAIGQVDVPGFVNADLKLTHFCSERRFKSDTPPLHLHTTHATGTASLLLLTIPAAR